MATIDIGEAGIVTVTASVLETTQQALSQNGLFFSESERLPTDTITSFSSDTAVGNFFGTSSDEYTAAVKYFKGFDGAFKKPTEIIFYRKVSSAAPAWLLGGSLAAMTLAELQVLTGWLGLDINGESRSFLISFGVASAKLLSGVLPDLATLKAVTGTLDITIDGENHEVTLSSLSATANLAEIADSIESDLAAAFTAGVTCIYNLSLDKFVISSTAPYAALAPSTLTSGTLPALATLQGVSGTLALTIDTETQTTGTIDLSGITTKALMAAEIQAELRAVFTADVACAYDSDNDKFIISSVATGAGIVITVATGTASAGLLLTTGTGAVATNGTGSKITIASGTAAAGLMFTTGTGAFAFAQHAAATSFSNAAQILDTELNNVFTENPITTFDIVANAFRITTFSAGTSKIVSFATGTLADNLKLRQVDGAIASQGAAITSYSDSIDNVWNANTKDFVSVATIPVLTNVDYLSLASWLAGKNDCAILFVHTTDAAVVDSQSVTDVNSVLAEAGYNCARGVYGTFESAAAQCGFIGCLDFDRVSGWGTLAFKQQSGLPTIEMTTADCIAARAKGYLFFSAFSTRASRVNYDHLGIFGDWAYPDVLAGKIVIVDRCQITIENVLLSSNIENNDDGRAIIRAAVSDSVFEAGKLAKAVSKGETLSQAQRDKANQLLNDPQGYQNIESNGYHIKMTPKTPGATDRHIAGIGVYQAGGFVHSVALNLKVQVN